MPPSDFTSNDPHTYECMISIFYCDFTGKSCLKDFLVRLALQYSSPSCFGASIFRSSFTIFFICINIRLLNFEMAKSLMPNLIFIFICGLCKTLMIKHIEQDLENLTGWQRLPQKWPKHFIKHLELFYFQLHCVILIK